jgi:hypothetical protein
MMVIILNYEGFPPITLSSASNLRYDLFISKVWPTYIPNTIPEGSDPITSYIVSRPYWNSCPWLPHHHPRIHQYPKQCVSQSVQRSWRSSHHCLVPTCLISWLVHGRGPIASVTSYLSDHPIIPCEQLGDHLCLPFQGPLFWN